MSSTWSSACDDLTSSTPADPAVELLERPASRAPPDRDRRTPQSVPEADDADTPTPHPFDDAIDGLAAAVAFEVKPLALTFAAGSGFQNRQQSSTEAITIPGCCPD